MNIRVLTCVYIREDLKNFDFVLIRCSCSEIRDNDRSTCLPLLIKWDDPVYGSKEDFLRSRLCSITGRPNNSRLLGVNILTGDNVSLYIANSLEIQSFMDRFFRFLFQNRSRTGKTNDFSSPGLYIYKQSLTIASESRLIGSVIENWPFNLSLICYALFFVTVFHVVRLVNALSWYVLTYKTALNLGNGFGFTLLHSEQLKFHRVWVVLSAIWYRFSNKAQGRGHHFVWTHF